MARATFESRRVLRAFCEAGQLQLHQNIPVAPAAAVEKLVRDAGFTPERGPWGLLRRAAAAVGEVHLVVALGERDHQIGKLVLVPGLAATWIEGETPDAHILVLEHDLIADWA